LSKKIAIAIPKGGVGKTTTAVNLAACLATLEKRTLLIDFDPAGACSLSLNLTQDKIKGGVIDVLSFTKSIRDVIHKTSLEYLDMIPCNVVDYDDEEKINRLTSNNFLFKNIMKQEIFLYDYIIMDCPPYLKGMTNLVLATVDSVIIPVKSAFYSIDALRKLVSHMKWVKRNYNSELKIEGILNTMFENRTKAAGMAENRLFKLIGNHVFNTSVPKTTKLVESTFYGKPIIAFDATSPGSQAYLNLAEEIIIRNKICPVIDLENKLNIKKLIQPAEHECYLYQNVPNPFNMNTSIKFEIKNDNKVKLTILNIHREVRELLIDEYLSSGVYEYNWEPRNLEDGVYYYRLDSGELNDTLKLIYFKEKKND
jgi:chromosome partitioning protein